MKAIGAICLLMLAATGLRAQEKPYFQQAVHYTIRVSLDDVRHRLDGQVTMRYVNHAPDTLALLWIHLWPNAYSDRSRTAFAHQQLTGGQTRLYFAKDEELGGCDSLAFTVNGQVARLEPDAKNPDIALLRLPRPLPPGDSVTIETPFRVKIPASFSRMGRIGQSYQITQWYPKPAVYDRFGWHPMPYLDQGEFYSEFGSFDVSITLPANYVVAATGELQTPSERAFLDRKASESPVFGNDSFPPSSRERKTIRFTADRVHDFAWFADKRFQVQQGSVKLPSGRTVTTRALFTPQFAAVWKDAISYLNRSVLFYSEKVGEYPYPHATALESALSAGSGMEYPMITVIGPEVGRDLDEVITHEIGHNWFYGILASNERDNAWQDEGINSYYEQRYMQTYYDKKYDRKVIPAMLGGNKTHETFLLYYLHLARTGQDQAPATPSQQLTRLNYGLSAYSKPAMLFAWLEQYLGTARFDACMQQYFRNWQFRHPYPGDLRRELEQCSGHDLGWLFDGMLGSTRKVDYALTGVRQTAGGFELRVKNRGSVPAPFPVTGFQDGKGKDTRWFEGFAGGTKTIFMPGAGYDKFQLDAASATLDLYRENNQIRTSGFLPRAYPVKLSVIPKVEAASFAHVYLTPIVAFNNYDKVQPGLALYRDFAPARSTEPYLLATYSFTSGSINGMAGNAWHFNSDTGPFRRWSAGLSGRTWHYNRDAHYGFYDRYGRIAVWLEGELRKKDPVSTVTQTLQLRNVWVTQRYGNGLDYNSRRFDYKSRDYNVVELSYERRNKWVLSPSQWTVTARGGDGFMNVFSNWQQSFTYANQLKGGLLGTKRRQSVQFRLFGGAFAYFEDRLIAAPFRLSGAPGFEYLQNDYLFDHSLLGRNDRNSIFSQQIFQQGAGLKTISNLANSTTWMLGGGISASLPLPIPLRAYFDAALFPGFDNKTTFAYSSGISLQAVPGVLEIYFPVLESDNIRTNVELITRTSDWPGLSRYLRRITFMLNLNQLSPFSLVRNLSL